MLLPTIILGILAVVLLYIGYSKGEQQHLTGLKTGLVMTLEILPLLIFALIVAGMVQVLLPAELISKWIGTESGMRSSISRRIMARHTPAGPTFFWAPA